MSKSFGDKHLKKSSSSTKVQCQFFPCFVCNCNRSFFAQRTRMHLNFFPTSRLKKNVLCMTTTPKKTPASAEIRSLKLAFLFIGEILPIICYFNCQSRRMEMKISFRHKCTSRRITRHCVRPAHNKRIYLRSDGSDWFKCAINKIKHKAGNGDGRVFDRKWTFSTPRWIRK